MACSGAVILCGGRSRRMGRDKASLPWGERTVLQHVVEVVGAIVPTCRIVVVAAAEQPLPELPGEVRIVRDLVPGQGPLAALVAGLSALQDDAETALVAACDAPLVRPAPLAWLLERLATAGPEVAGVVPESDGRLHPLTAAYWTNIVEALTAALAAGKRSLHEALRGTTVELLAAEELRKIDPELAMLVNCNTPEEFAAAEATSRLAGVVMTTKEPGPRGARLEQ
ncbi:MAG: molybdenum cofactor guanylyltransferase [Pirellulales bacterium]|nr:molybdenum cofactor guanylyltransferase [Pirellulales bacterium]